jgi:Bacterial Ig-like domain (group 3)/MBG domain (YGX type)
VGVNGTIYGPSANPPVNAGNYAVTNMVAADSTFDGLTNSQTFIINPASASVTADAKTKAYGAVNPTLTATVEGQVIGGDVINYGLTTDAGQYSAVGVSNIIVILGSNPNYSVLATNSTLTINPASTFVGASSTENPSGYKDTISFLATLPSDATGSVVFSSTNGPISTNSVSSGSATSLSITNLPRGTNVITVVYLGDSNYLGSTNNLDQIVTNHPPVANVMTVTRTAGLALIISLSDIATNWSDVDGDTVELTSVTMQSTNGVNLFPLNWSTNLDGSIVTTNGYAYIGYTNSPNVNDRISYSISDGQGGTNIGYVNILVQGSVTGTNSITAYNFTSPNSNSITAYGIPYFSYILERSTNLSSSVWVDVQTNQAAPNGLINLTDQFIDLGGNKPSPAFYQLKWQP